MRRPNIRTKRRVAAALRRHVRSMEDWVRWTSTTTKMRPHAANAFLLGVMLDRSVKAELAWDAADWICWAIGDSKDPALFWKELATMEPVRLRGFLRYGYGGRAFHRHYKTFGRLLPEAAKHILGHYHGDPRRIWNNQRDVHEVGRRLDAIPAIGPALAKMAVLILARQHGLLGGRRARRHLDVKPDIHVNRVFRRTGLVERGASTDAIIAAARALAPDFPAALDAPAWDIGSKWCRPSYPRCTDCPLSRVCPRIGERLTLGSSRRATARGSSHRSAIKFRKGGGSRASSTLRQRGDCPTWAGVV